MSDYTPTTDEVRADYVRARNRGYDEYQGDQTLTAMQEHYGAEFDRWLAQHDAQILHDQAVEVYALSEEMHRRADVWAGEARD
jgi:hypothetical protein